MERRVDYRRSGGRAPRGARGRGCGGAPLGSATRRCGRRATRPTSASSPTAWAGWTSPTSCWSSSRACSDFVDEARADGLRHAVLLGMGGSSLAAEVMAFAFGQEPGYLELSVFDTTDPAAIAALEARLDLEAHAVPRLQQVGRHHGDGQLSRLLLRAAHASSWAPTMPARTSWPSPTTARRCSSEALEQDFRAVFLNAADIGGRYSALSYFGIVPAALAGIDLQTPARAGAAHRRSVAATRRAGRASNAALVFGAALGELARAGRDKLTIVASPPVGNFGAWARAAHRREHRQGGHAASSPSTASPWGRRSVYGEDRVFVYLRLRAAPTPAPGQGHGRAGGGGLPRDRLAMDDVYDMGSRVPAWELAVAVAGHVLGIDPFDQPNVQESKDNTRRVLAQLEQRRRGCRCPSAAGGEAVAYGLHDDDLDGGAARLRRAPCAARLRGAAGLRHARERVLAASCRPCACCCATPRAGHQRGYGPRFLHSTGQSTRAAPHTAPSCSSSRRAARSCPSRASRTASGA